MHVAFAVKSALKGWNIDTSSLPPLIVVDSGGEPVEEWLQEWIEVVKEFGRLAPPERLEKELAYLREIVYAYRVVADGTPAFVRRQPRDDDDE